MFVILGKKPARYMPRASLQKKPTRYTQRAGFAYALSCAAASVIAEKSPLAIRSGRDSLTRFPTLPRASLKKKAHSPYAAGGIRSRASLRCRERHCRKKPTRYTQRAGFAYALPYAAASVLAYTP